MTANTPITAITADTQMQGIMFLGCNCRKSFMVFSLLAYRLLMVISVALAVCERKANWLPVGLSSCFPSSIRLGWGDEMLAVAYFLVDAQTVIRFLLQGDMKESVTGFGLGCGFVSS